METLTKSNQLIHDPDQNWANHYDLSVTFKDKLEGVAFPGFCL